MARDKKTQEEINKAIKKYKKKKLFSLEALKKLTNWNRDTSGGSASDS